MSDIYRIAIDTMSGDHGLHVTIPAAISALNHYSDTTFILVGDQQQIESQLSVSKANFDKSRLLIQNASQVVAMDESPVVALKKKKDSSMRVSINLVKSGDADAAVSAGNTGALMATAKYVLKTIPGIDRPALMTALPSSNGHTHILDLGANVDSSASQLHQFAVMGSLLASIIDKQQEPKIGLLNVGQEAIKGNAQVREANELLQQSNINYIGYIEGDDIYHGDVDVVVCDGFIGNVVLKASEGLANFIQQEIKLAFYKNILTKLSGLVAMPVLKSFRTKIDPRKYNGASLLGLQGIVIKSHGGADEVAFENALRIARIEAEQNVPNLIASRVKQVLNIE